MDFAFFPESMCRRVIYRQKNEPFCEALLNTLGKAKASPLSWGATLTNFVTAYSKCWRVNERCVFLKVEAWVATSECAVWDRYVVL